MGQMPQLTLDRGFPRRTLAFALGIPAALLGHLAVFASGHAAGGPHHSFVVDATLAAGFTVFAWMALSSLRLASHAAQGSIVASRLEHLLPSLAPLGASALAWYAAIEILEGRPIVSLAAILSVVLAAAVLHAGLRALARALATIAVAVLAPAKPGSPPFAVRVVPAVAPRAYARCQIDARSPRAPPF